MTDIALQFGSHNLSVQAEALSSSKPVYRVTNEDEKTKIRNVLCNYQRFQRDYFIKWFPMRIEAERELRCLKKVGESPYFHRFPWVYPELGNCNIEGRQGYALLLEFIEAPPILKHFRTRYRERLDLRLILLQYCNAFVDSLDTLQFLHRCQPPIFHCDIKPDNIMFHNNFLKIIDFDNAHDDIRSAAKFDTPRYLPGYVLKAMLERRSIQCLDLVDLQLGVVTFLEIFVNVFSEQIGDTDDFKKISEAVQTKEAVPVTKAPRDQLIDFMEADKHIVNIVKDWKNDPNDLKRLFSTISFNDEDAEAYAASCARSTVATLYASACKLVLTADAARSKCVITATIPPDQFGTQMEKTLISSTSDIFSNFYPLMYLDYSESVGAYDAPSEKAAEKAAKYLETHHDTGPCLDVGSSFGTAAFQAAKQRLTSIYCLDNSPVFQRLANLLWAEVEDEKWQAEARCFIQPELLAIASTYTQLVDGQEAGQYFMEILSRKRQQFAPYRDQIKHFFLADYWSLAERLLAIVRGEKSENFKYIVCNNFLHWPVIGFENLGKITRCNDNLDLGKTHLRHLLLPLLSVLGTPGVLAIIEPSQFFRDDTDSKDAEFHEARFTQQPMYRNVLNEVYEQLLPNWFGFEKKLGGPPRREEKFTASAIRTAIEEECPSCHVEITRYTHYKINDWKRLIIGEFMMTMRNFSQDEIRKVISADTNKITGFYREFSEIVERKSSLAQIDPVESLYMIYVLRSGS